MDKKRIFIVEDEGIVAKDIQKCLQNSGYSVLGVADTGEEAQKQAELLKPDLILMDIVLKGEIDGIEAAQYIRDYLNIPVVYLTAYSDKSILKRAKVTEPFGYLIKPFLERELKSTIEMALYKHKTEQSIRENSLRLDKTLQRIGEAVIATDARGSVTFLSSIAQKLTGFSEQDAIGKSLTEILRITDENGDSLDPAYHALITGKTFDFPCTLTLTTRDSKKLKITGSCKPVFGENSSSLGSILIFCDITNRYQIEEDLYRTYRLDSLSNLIDSVSSDYNDIISRIMRNINQARLHAESDDELATKLEETENACNRVKSLNDKLLILTKTEPITKERISLSELITCAVNDNIQDIPIDVNFSLQENLWNVEVNKELMKQVLSQVITNAVESIDETGGIIEITAENITTKPYQLPLLQKCPCVRITIKDNGFGISKENLSKVFDPLFTTKPQREGLGLALAYSYIKRHKGTITIDSTPDTGTTVCLYIPAYVS